MPYKLQDSGPHRYPAYIEHVADLLFVGYLGADSPFVVFNLLLDYFVKLDIKLLMVLSVY